MQPVSAATTVRIADGKPQVLDGPYADSKEQLGGYYLIEVPDLDAAIAWAARCPGAATARSRCARSGRCRIAGRNERPREGDEQARSTAEAVARRSYGKLVAFLAARTHDVAAAEDALSEAFAAALADWPREGLPVESGSWLLTVARRKVIERHGGIDRGEMAAEQLADHAEGLEPRRGRERRFRIGGWR